MLGEKSNSYRLAAAGAGPRKCINAGRQAVFRRSRFPIDVLLLSKCFLHGEIGQSMKKTF